MHRREQRINGTYGARANAVSAPARRAHSVPTYPWPLTGSPGDALGAHAKAHHP